MIKIKLLKASDLTNRNVVDMNRLFRQLSSKSHEYSEKFMPQMRRLTKKAKYFGAFDGDKMIGLASIHFMETGTKQKSHIEDVVVEAEYQRNGIGTRLNQKLINEALKKQAGCIDLTSNPKRRAANLMYKKLGYKKRDTNCYRLEL